MFTTVNFILSPGFNEKNFHIITIFFWKKKDSNSPIPSSSTPSTLNQNTSANIKQQKLNVSRAGLISIISPPPCGQEQLLLINARKNFVDTIKKTGWPISPSHPEYFT